MDLLLLYNNVFASKCFDKIVNEIKDCGFHCGATYTPPNEYAVAIEHLRAKKKENRNVRVYIKMMLAIYDRIAEKLSDEEQTNFYLERERRNLLYPIYADVKAILDFDKEYKRTHKIGLSELYEKLFKRTARVRYIDFNQGVDARLVTNEKMQKLAELNIRPLRIAFDRLKMKDIYIKAVKTAVKYGIKNLSNYLLYNHNDKPEELYERLKINVDLCEELGNNKAGVSIYSFPMKYHPIDDPLYFDNRDYIGKYWNKKFIRAIQAVLNSTKGKIGRGKAFFEEAFGRNIDEFMDIMRMPETFIIHRFKYKENQTKEWRKQFNALNEEQRTMVEEFIAANVFSDFSGIQEKKILAVLEFYKTKRDK
ncbi:MAG: hypothetical protein LBN39_04690 [Planctomycetaceae bacterium]|jgi:hypothetical protein|nr:hypothetical protein [Planctomycetaceae bacterium]